MAQAYDGIQIVLTAPQLAAVLTQESISEHATLSNRLWGGLRVVGGTLELAGAGVLCVAPEPTMMSKVGCVVFGVHGADTTGTGFRQVWTGRDSQSLTHMGTAALAKALGASDSMADNIGLTVDIAVPIAMSLGIGATRIVSIRAGRISLIEHEAAAGSRLGGHTILKHVGKTEAELRARLATQRGIQGASSFKTLDHAERSVSAGLRANAATIKGWAAKSGVTNGRISPLILEHDMGTVVGRGLMRSTDVCVPMTRVKILLKFEFFQGKPYYVLTAYPI